MTVWVDMGLVSVIIIPYHYNGYHQKEYPISARPQRNWKAYPGTSRIRPHAGRVRQNTRYRANSIIEVRERPERTDFGIAAETQGVLGQEHRLDRNGARSGQARVGRLDIGPYGQRR